MTDSSKIRGAGVFFLIFTLSGFAGLIYESIWSHYLKLFLGHAAYAQSLVLIIFMGGMAVGAGLCARYTGRWRRLMRGYAIAEALIGVSALIFHPIFTGFLELSYDRIMPALGTPWMVQAWKWGSASLLILPQTILLGMTFPLMTAGLLRRFPDRSGASISALYFTNSLGGAIGVLASGFFLIAAFGLPGTVATAGIVNLFLAVVVWILAGKEPEPNVRPVRAVAPGEGSKPAASVRLLLLIAAGTGAASFIYEIAWIRMLSLVLGASTHAFELMLSAFILGLALGGLWIRKRIDRLDNPIRFLARVQLIMGLLAVATLPLYVVSFDFMAWAIETLPKTEAGYNRFNLVSHAIALMVMLPATFCAGTTLPLITHSLLRQGHGERSIGAVYAWNTVGAILGVLVAVHIGLPLLGLKGVLGVGAATDLVLALLLIFGIERVHREREMAWFAGATASAALILILTQMDPMRLHSGVFRTGRVLDANQTVLWSKDGKSASVSVSNYLAQDKRTIRTNGKPDASIVLGVNLTESPDEHTMTMLATLGLAYHPNPTTAANIGFGSGMTTHVMLAHPGLQRVDTIEIEPAMVEGARYFGDRVSRAYDDPRSRVHIEDAKSYFSTRANRYDVIVSEPSNPWVSGTAGLFSTEFYDQAKRYLNEGGRFVQWLHFYEMDQGLVVSVLKAIDSNFADYDIYTSVLGDMIIVASASEPLPAPSWAQFQSDSIRAELERIGLRNLHDLRIRWAVNKRALSPFLGAHPAPVNSDYRPFLDQNAARARYLGGDPGRLFSAEFLRYPIAEMLGAFPAQTEPRNPPSRESMNWHTVYSQIASKVFGYVGGGDWEGSVAGTDIPPNIQLYAQIARTAITECEQAMDQPDWIDGMYNSVIKRLAPNLGTSELVPVWDKLTSETCWTALDPFRQALVKLWQSMTRRDAAGLSRNARTVLQIQPKLHPTLLHHVLVLGMLGDEVGENSTGAQALWHQYSEFLPPELKEDFATQVLLAHVFEKP